MNQHSQDTIVSAGLVGTGKSTTSLLLKEELNGVRLGTDTIRTQLFPNYPDTSPFENAPLETMWGTVLDWLEKQDDIEHLNLLVAMTTTHGINLPKSLRERANPFLDLRAQQSAQTYAELLDWGEQYILSYAGPLILDATFGRKEGTSSRTEILQRFAKYGNTYLIQFTCPEQIAKEHIRARGIGKIDPGGTLARDPKIYDHEKEKYDPISIEEPFTQIIAYNVATQEVTVRAGLEESYVLNALIKLSSALRDKTIKI